MNAVASDADQWWRGYLWKVYGLTEDGRTFLAEHNLLAGLVVAIINLFLPG